MSNKPQASVPGEPERSPAPPLSPEQTQQLRALASRLKQGPEPARPKRGPLTSEEASQKSRAYWDTLGPVERRIRTLSARIGVGKAAERELEELLAQLEAQQQDGEAAGGAS